jgi:hypothetical protein
VFVDFFMLSTRTRLSTPDNVLHRGANEKIEKPAMNVLAVCADNDFFHVGAEEPNEFRIVLHVDEAGFCLLNVDIQYIDHHAGASFLPLSSGFLILRASCVASSVRC